MTLRYASTNRVVESLREIADEVGFGDGSVKLSVYETDATVCNAHREDMEERNLFGYVGDELCSFEYDGAKLSLHFHENQVEGTFALTPAGTGAISPDQATNPAELAPGLEGVLFELSHELDVISYDFAEVSAASIATGGYLTDFEFEYEVVQNEI